MLTPLITWRNTKMNAFSHVSLNSSQPQVTNESCHRWRWSIATIQTATAVCCWNESGKDSRRFIYIIRNKAHLFDINVRLLKGLAFRVMRAFMICVDSLCLTLTDSNSWHWSKLHLNIKKTNLFVDQCLSPYISSFSFTHTDCWWAAAVDH